MPKTCLCFRCPAKCCRYLSLQFDAPRKPSEFDKVRWYLSHEDVFVFVEAGKWFLHLYSRCDNLRADNRCGIYDSRPRICRVYSNDDCDFTGSDYEWEAAFYTPAQFELYAQRKLGGKLPPMPVGAPIGPTDGVHEIPVFLDTPSAASDLDDIRWYAMHDRVRIRVDGDDRWTLLYRARPVPGLRHPLCSGCAPAAAPAPPTYPRIFGDADSVLEFGRSFLGLQPEAKT